MPSSRSIRPPALALFVIAAGGSWSCGGDDDPPGAADASAPTVDASVPEDDGGVSRPDGGPALDAGVDAGVNRPPRFESASAEVAIPENTTGPALTAEATDPDGDALSYAVSGPDASRLSVDPARGVLRFADPPNFEAPGDADGDNRYELEVSAEDAAGARARLTLTLLVTDVDEPPVFASPARTSSPENRLDTGYRAEATDPEGAPVVFGLAGGSDGELFRIDGASGRLFFESPPDFESPADANGDNAYALVLSAEAATLTSTLAVVVEATGVDEAPTFNLPLSFSVVEGETAVGSARATDPEGQPVEHLLSGPDAARLAIDRASGALRFAAAADFEAPADADGDNLYVVTVEARGAGPTASATATIAVTDRDEAPVFSSGGTARALENGTATDYVPAAADPEGAPVTYSVSGGPDAAALAVAGSPGRLELTAPPDFEAPSDANADGRFEIVLTASDGTRSSTRAVSVEVVDVDEPPVFSGAATGTVAENQRVTTYRAMVSDPEGDPVTLSLGGPDRGLFLFDGARNLTFTDAPDYESPADADGDNVYSVTVTAEAGGLSAVQTATVTVIDVDEPPVFVSGAAVAVDENRVDTGYRVEATDPEGRAVSYAIGGGADAARFSLAGSSLLFVTAPDFEAPSDADGNNRYVVELTATDGTGSTRQTVTVSVDDVPRALRVDFPPEGAELGGVASTVVSGVITDAPPSVIGSVTVGGSPASVVAGPPTRFSASVPVSPGEPRIAIEARFTGGDRASLDLDVKNQALFFDAVSVAVGSGTAYVLDPDRGAILQVGLTTGDRAELSGPSRGSGTTLTSPDALILDPSQSRLLLLDDGRDALISIDLSSGDRAIVSGSADAGPDFELPAALTLDAAQRRVLATDNFLDALLEVDLGTGTRREVSGPNVGSGPRLFTPRGVAYDPVTQTAWVTEALNDEVIAIDTRNGQRSSLSSATRGTGPSFTAPRGLAFDGSRLLVTDSSRGRILAVDIRTGDRTLVVDDTIGAGPDLQSPFDLALTSTRTAVVADFQLGLIEADLVNGNTRILSAPTEVGSGTAVDDAVDLAIDRDGGRLVLLDDRFGSSGIVELDLANLSRRVIASGSGTAPQPRQPQRLVLDGRRALVSDRNGALFEIDLSSGSRSIISDDTTGSGVRFRAPVGLALDRAGGRAFVGDRDLDAVLEVDLSSGNRSSISATGSGLDHPRDLLFDGGRVLVAEGGSRAALLAVDIATGAGTILSSSGFSGGVGTGPDLDRPMSVDLDASRNRAFVADENEDHLIAVDLTSGDRTLVSGGSGSSAVGAGPPLLRPHAGAVDLEGGFGAVIVDEGGYEAVLLIDLATGQRVLVAF